MIVVEGLMIILIIILAIKLWNCENRLDIAKSDIDELYEWVNEYRERFDAHKELIEALSKSVRELQERRKAPEIVRCGECKHRDPEDKKCDCGHDIIWQLPRDDDWFLCRCGEKTCGKRLKNLKNTRFPTQVRFAENQQEES